MPAGMEHIAALSRCLDYPTPGYQDRVAAATTGLIAACPGAGKRLGEFSDYAAELEITELEELFTRTFDVNPSCTLETGWHLYGEQYERGAFLVRMRELLRGYGIVEGNELPDHLTYALQVVGRMPADSAAGFVSTEVLPAMEKMRAGFKGGSNPYEAVIDAIWMTLSETFKTSEARS
jgi:nitrate reductase delta subunit